jgi:hypothetical protein
MSYTALGPYHGSGLGVSYRCPRGRRVALRGMVWPHPKRIFLYYQLWLLAGHAGANEVIDEMRVAAATGAITTGDVARALKLLPQPTRHR